MKKPPPESFPPALVTEEQIKQFATEEIQGALKQIPNSKVIDRDVVVDLFLDLQQTLSNLENIQN